MPFVPVLSFNAGELSPYLDVRSDLDKYSAGCRTLENFITMPYGGVYRRPGTEYLGAAKMGGKRCRLLGFNFSTTTRFVLELGEQYIRFWSSSGVLVESSPGVPLEVSSPYLEDDLRDIQFVQINDVCYFVHPNYPPRKLTRVSDTNWTFDEVVPDYPAVLDENIESTTITPSATTGTSITLTASASIFEAGHIGGYWAIGHVRGTTSIEKSLASTGTSSDLLVLGKWTLTTSGNWQGTLIIQRSYDGGSTWEDIRNYVSPAVGARNVSATGDEERLCKLRLNYTNSGTGTSSPMAVLEITDNKLYGVVQITAVASGTSATGHVINDLFATSATPYWAEAAWSPKQGYPRTVALHEQRMMYGGTKLHPQSIFGSKVDDFENFRLSSSDDSGLFFTLSAQQSNPIQWMTSQDQLLIGTAGDEWSLGSTTTDEPITPTNVRTARQSSYGSKYLRALVVNDVILFVQRQGRKVRELVYSFERDGWTAPDLTVLAEHATRGEILECAFQQQPDAIYWTITGQGQLVGMTYERDQNVVGWHRHTTDGVFESVATIYGGTNGADEVWLAVQREVDGQTVRYIERFKTDFREVFEAETKADWWYLDCAKRVILDPSDTEVSGLDHLEGKEVHILADGAVSAARTVEGGEITLQEPASVVLAGLPFTSSLQPMKLEIQMQDGASRGRKKRISRMFAAIHKSLGGEFSSDGETWDWMYSREFSDPMDASPPVFTGDKNVYVAGSASPSADIILRQAQPLPLTIQALVLKLDVTET